MSGSKKISFGQKKNIALFSLLLTLCAASCSTTKNLPKGETLFVGADISIQDELVSTRYQKIVTHDLQEALRPEPNSRFLGLPIKLLIYNLAGDTSKNGFIRKALRKIGEPPVPASRLDLAENERLFVNILQNRGFFYPVVHSSQTTKNRKTKATFEVWTGSQYLIRSVFFPEDSSQLSQDISGQKEESLLKPGLPYNLSLIEGERSRIALGLTENGYYYFQPDYLIAEVDTTVGVHELDIFIKPKYNQIPEKAFHVYHINNVYIYPHFTLHSQGGDLQSARFHNGYYVVDKENTFRPIVFEQAMQFEPGDVYNLTEQNRSLNRLISLSTFKFVKNKFEPVEKEGRPYLDVHYYLTPYAKKSLQFQIGVQSRNDSHLGTNTSVSWKNRNAFRGAELFSVTVRGGYEAQAGGQIKRPPAFEGGLETALSIPRFLVPFFEVESSSLYMPRTQLKLSYDLSSRPKLYRIHSFKSGFGYLWKESIRKEHQFFPINVNYVRTDTLTTAALEPVDFDNLLFTGLIVGPSYEFTFNTQATGLQRDNYYFNGLVDLSNNLLGLIHGASPDNPRKIFGSDYAQYLKFRLDGRYYFHYSPVHKNNIWANRIVAGIGIPYGNSRKLPNIKQFFSGGASSLRGFPARMVGPGAYAGNYTEGDASTRQYIDMLGDMKLELNTEWRANLYKFLNGALFLDAGNIWIFYEDPRFPEGEFTGDFFQQLAVDGGVGLRLDFEFFLLRLDLAMPFRKPWMPEGERWVFDQIDLGSRSWRRENLIFNLAIGYPF